MKILLTAVSAFIGTNMDDIFILMLLFSQYRNKKQQHSIVLGQYIGIGILIFISMLSAEGIRIFNTDYIGLLGIIPVLLGIKQWSDYRKSNEENTDFDFAKNPNILFNTAFITLTNGADNLGVYIPLFSVLTKTQFLYIVIIFSIMTAFLCVLGKKIADLPSIHKLLFKHRHIIVPAVLISLGLFLIADSFII